MSTSQQGLEESKAIYLATARLLTELITLEDESRKVRYLSFFAQAPSVAHQIASVLIMGLALSNIAKQKNSDIDPFRVIELLLWHDAPEARYGDIGRDQRKYIAINEDRTRHDLFGSLPWGMEIVELIEHFENGGEDINAKVARDADALYVIYTICDLLEKGYIINEPDVRIQKTLNRLATEEGFLLGTQMAVRKPAQIWKLLFNTANISGTPQSPKDRLATDIAIAWNLSEIIKINSNNKKTADSDLRRQVVRSLLGGNSTSSSLVRNIIADSQTIYDSLATRRKSFQNKKVPDMGKISEGKFKTPEGKALATYVNQTDLYDWWNLMMGYLTLNQDGTIEKKQR